jgi:hypothetical protein
MFVYLWVYSVNIPPGTHLELTTDAMATSLCYSVTRRGTAIIAEVKALHIPARNNTPDVLFNQSKTKK